MAGRGVDRLGVSRRRAVAAAIVRRAEMRAALQYFPRDADIGLTSIKARGLWPAARILRHAARLGRIGLVSRGPPIDSPFPDIADHVVNAVAIRWKLRHRGRSFKAILAEIFEREISLPGISHVPAFGRQRVTSGIFLAVEPAARGELPFCLGRQVLTRPL